MIELVEGRHACVDLLVGVEGIPATDVACRSKRAGAPAWRHKELTPSNWQDVGHGVYMLSLEPADIEEVGRIVVLTSPVPSAKQKFAPALHVFDVVEARLGAGIPAIPKTTICGYVVTLDERGKAKAQVTARVAQFPLVLGGAGISNDVVTVETSDEGYFEMSVVTGALINVQIPAISYTRQFVVPPPPAPGIPIRLFSL